MERRSPHAVLRMKQAAVLAIGVSILTVSGSASANRVTLIATINNQSVLSPASWAIFAVGDKAKKQAVATLPRHSGTVELPAGQYFATVKLDQEGQGNQIPRRVQSGQSGECGDGLNATSQPGVLVSTQRTAPSASVSRFQKGALCLRVSMIWRQASNASARCADQTATNTIGLGWGNLPDPMHNQDIIQ